MRLSAQLSQRMEQRQILTQQLIQNMELLQVPIQELQAIISAELEENPTLELKQDVEEPASDGAADGQAEATAAEAPAAETAEQAEADRVDLLDQIESERDVSRSLGGPSRSSAPGEEDEERQEFLMNQAPESVSLNQHLAGQLIDAEVSEDVRRVAEHLINNIDETGYLRFRPEDTATILSQSQYSGVAYEDLLGMVRQSPAKYAPEAVAQILMKVYPDVPFADLLARVQADPRGRTLEALAVLMSSSFPGKTIEELVHLAGEALALIQLLEPKGVGARDTVECLLLQLDPGEPEYAKKKFLIERHLDDILQNQLPTIAQKLIQAPAPDGPFHYSPATPIEGVVLEIQTVVQSISALRPTPGRMFSAEPNPAVIPDLVVQEVDGRHEIVVQESFLPTVSINHAYVDMVRNKSVSKEERDFIRKKLEASRRILTAIEQRRWTLHRIGDKIVEHQREFFERGIECLKPLTRTKLAEELGIHLSTVARAVKDKYIQTPRGIYSLRFFFAQEAPHDGPKVLPSLYRSSPSSDNSGQPVTRNRVLEKIREIVAAEDKKNPLSDKQIGERLQTELAIKLKRRTIAKYREEAGILSTRQRKVW